MGEIGAEDDDDDVSGVGGMTEGVAGGDGRTRPTVSVVRAERGRPSSSEAG